MNMNTDTLIALNNAREVAIAQYVKAQGTDSVELYRNQLAILDQAVSRLDDFIASTIA